MTDPTLTMHRTFLAELRQKRQAIAEELHRLETVERYHLNRISELSRSPSAPAEVEEVQPENTPIDPTLEGLRKYDACRVALKQLGGRRKTAEVVEWLVSRGYGSSMEKRIFHNACFTAMDRKKEVFKRTKGGVWQLIEKPSNP